MAFADTNYTVVYSLQVLTGNGQTDNGIVALTAAGIQIALTGGQNGQQVSVHAVAFHD